jgi:hypothetical protein
MRKRAILMMFGQIVDGISPRIQLLGFGQIWFPEELSHPAGQAARDILVEACLLEGPFE